MFTHLLPAGAASYFNQTRRILRPAGRAVFSVFLLDFYRPGHWRPPGFDSRYFDFDHVYEDYGDDFAIVDEAIRERCWAEGGRAGPGWNVVRDGGSLGQSQDLLVLERAVNRKRRRLPKRLRASITER